MLIYKRREGNPKETIKLDKTNLNLQIMKGQVHLRCSNQNRKKVENQRKEPVQSDDLTGTHLKKVKCKRV